jgi:hypothetical protein
MHLRFARPQPVFYAAVLVALMCAAGCSSSSDGGPSGSAGNSAGGGAGARAGGSGAGGLVNAGAGAGSPSAGAGFGASSGTSGTSGVVDPAFPLKVPAQRHIAAGSLVTCAVNSDGATCWGAPGGAMTSSLALTGAFGDITIGSYANTQPVCGLAQDGSTHCMEWTGEATSLFKCTPAGKFSDLAFDRQSGELALVDQGGAIQAFDKACDADKMIPPGLTAMKRVTVAAAHFCALGSDGKASCWMQNTGTLETTLVDDFVDIAAGETGACALTRAGKVRCWDGTGTEDLNSLDFAQQVSAGADAPPVVQLASDGTGHNLCALFNDGKVLCSQDFNLGFARSSQLPMTERVVEVAVGGSHLCGIRSDGSVLCQPFGCQNCAAAITPPQGFKATP